METPRIGLVTLVVLALLAIGLGLAMNAGQPALVLGLVLACALFVVSFLSTPVSLYLLVFSMLLGPEVMVVGLGGAGAIASRGITLRLDDFLLVVIGFAWLVKAAIRKDESLLKWTPLNAPIMLYVAASVLATLIGVLAGRVNPATGFFFNLKYFEYFFLYFMVVNSVTTQQQARGLVIASLVTCFLVSLYALAQIPTGERASAPFEGPEGEPNTLGGYLVFMLSITAGLLLTRGAAPRKLPLVILFVVGFLALLATLSRSSLAAAGLVALVILGYTSYRKPLMFAVVLLAVVSAPFWAPDAVKQRVLFTFTQSPKEIGQVRVGGVRVDTSTSDRLRQWRKSLDYFQQSPVWGTGVTGAFLIDSMYPRVLTETGLLGLTGFLLICWRAFRVARTCYQEAEDPPTRGVALGFLLGFLALLVHALGSNTFIIVRIMEPFCLYLALLAKAFLSLQGGQRAEEAWVAPPTGSTMGQPMLGKQASGI